MHIAPAEGEGRKRGGWLIEVILQSNDVLGEREREIQFNCILICNRFSFFFHRASDIFFSSELAFDGFVEAHGNLIITSLSPLTYSPRSPFFFNLI